MIIGVLIFVIVISSVSLLLSKLWNTKKLLWISLSLILPAILTTRSYVFCITGTLEAWFWLNCGLSLPQRIIALTTMPSFNISLLASIMAILGIIRNDRRLVALAIITEAGLLGYKSIYLNLKYHMLLSAPNIPPLGYSVVRSNVGNLYLLFYILSLAFVIDYYLNNKQLSLKLSILLLSITLLLFFWWSTAAYGAPIALTFYHLAILLTWLEAIALYHKPTKLDAIGLGAAYATSLVIHRAYPVRIAAMAPPFFALQTGIAISLLVVIIISLYYALKKYKGLYSSFSLLSVSSILLAGFSTYSLIFEMLYQKAYFELQLAMLVTALTSIGVLIPIALKLGYLGILPFIGLAHPYLGLAIAAFLTLLSIISKKKSLALMVLIATLTSLVVIYASTIVVMIPTVHMNVKGFTCSESGVHLIRYKTNITAIRYNVNFIANTSMGKIIVPTTSLINVYENHYIPPNLLPYTLWSGIKVYNFVGICAITGRTYLGLTAWNGTSCAALNNFTFYLVCTPLGLIAFAVPILSIIYCLLLKKRSVVS